MGFEIVNFANWVVTIYWYLIIARILLSWFPDISNMSFGQWVFRLTEPYLAPFRRIIPPLPLGGMYLDISIYAAIIAYYFAEQGLMWLVQYLLIITGLY